MGKRLIKVDPYMFRYLATCKEESRVVASAPRSEYVKIVIEDIETQDSLLGSEKILLSGELESTKETANDYVINLPPVSEIYQNSFYQEAFT